MGTDRLISAVTGPIQWRDFVGEKKISRLVESTGEEEEEEEEEETTHRDECVSTPIPPNTFDEMRSTRSNVFSF